MPSSARKAVYVGSFDPLTLGHEDIIRRGARLYDTLIVGIGTNPDKQSLFTPDERLQICRQVLSPMSNVEVKCFEGLAVDFVRDCEALVMLRGMRTLTDIEAEFTMSLANRTLAPDIETVFLMASDRFTHISSTLIKQIAQMGRRDSEVQLRDFVPPEFVPELLKKFEDKSPSPMID